jgi:hypothetical protein
MTNKSCKGTIKIAYMQIKVRNMHEKTLFFGQKARKSKNIGLFVCVY